MNFGLVGAAGFIAPRHMRAMKDVGGELVAAVDPHDSVGILDSYFPDCRFFTEIERFDRHLEKLRRSSPEKKVDYISICTPNYLHDAHARLALRVKADAICEKPLVINPWNLDALQEIEDETDQKVHCILQLRHHPAISDLRTQIHESTNRQKIDVSLAYVTRRGSWYDASWKTDMSKSGGVAMNIGIHFYDMLMWIFGEVEYQEVHLNDGRRMSGYLDLERARVKWFLSVEESDLPERVRAQGKFAHRSILIDGQELDFSQGFTDLHTVSYQEIVAGRGFGLQDARPSIDLVYKMRMSEVVSPRDRGHPMLVGG